MKGRLMWVGDAVAATGFAKATHGICDVLRHHWDVHVLGINYRGDPHDYPYPIWPAMGGWQRGMDAFGVNRLGPMASMLKPDVIVVLNDVWNIPAYLKKAGNCPVIAMCMVDGKNSRGDGLNGCLACVFVTDFGRDEAHRGGYQGVSATIPLGVDLETFEPRDRQASRKALGLPPKLQREGFIVGNVNRNQPRKRLDLTIQYFAEWVRANDVNDAYLYLHVAPTGDQGYDVNQLCKFYGIGSRLIIAEPEIGMGIDEDRLVDTYNAFDIQVSTSQGEGFGLTTLEGMACGVPQIVPDWAALAEICPGAALMVPCTTQACTPNNINAIGGIADREEFIACLDRLYREPAERDRLTAAGILLAAKPCYRWQAIGEAMVSVIDQAMSPAQHRSVTRGDEAEDQADGRRRDGGTPEEPGAPVP